jgi:hypothetical protein
MVQRRSGAEVATLRCLRPLADDDTVVYRGRIACVIGGMGFAFASSHVTLTHRPPRHHPRGESNALNELPARVGAVEIQLVEVRRDITTLQDDVKGLRVDVTGLQSDVKGLRTDLATLRGDFESFRVEVRGEFVKVRAEIRAGDEETRRQMRVLHEEVISRIALLQEGMGRSPRGKRSRRRGAMKQH